MIDLQLSKIYAHMVIFNDGRGPQGPDGDTAGFRDKPDLEGSHAEHLAMEYCLMGS